MNIRPFQAWSCYGPYYIHNVRVVARTHYEARRIAGIILGLPATLIDAWGPLEALRSEQRAIAYLSEGEHD